mgnify:CR=1 FL=1
MATAADYPTRPIRYVVGFAPGGSSDVVSRLMAQRLSPILGQQVVVENKPGVNGMLGADAVAKAAPDGHMIWMGTMVQLSNDLLDRKMPFDPVKDLIPVIGLVDAGSMFVNSMQFPARTLQELLVAARATPGPAPTREEASPSP